MSELEPGGAAGEAGVHFGGGAEARSRGQRWRTWWHGPGEAPAGTPHGSAGICVAETGEVVMVSADGHAWEFPAGRPEAGEDWEQTLCREMLEEACAVVREARLLGFVRGLCVEGAEEGLVLVRSVWSAHVRLLDWRPRFEIRYRRLVPPGAAIDVAGSEYAPIWRRAFAEAGLG